MLTMKHTHTRVHPTRSHTGTDGGSLEDKSVNI